MKKRAYITHVTSDYLAVARNLARSLQAFSELPLIIFVLNLDEEKRIFFDGLPNVLLRNIDLELEDSSSEDYVFNSSGNFLISGQLPGLLMKITPKPDSGCCLQQADKPNTQLYSRFCMQYC